MLACGDGGKGYLFLCGGRNGQIEGVDVGTSQQGLDTLDGLQ